MLDDTISTILGLGVVLVKDQPRYVMPEWLIPGVLRWPQALRDETNTWAARVCGTANLLKDGEVIQARGNLMMNPKTYQALKEQA